MRVLRLGLNGPDVSQWQTFLLGQGLFHSEVSGYFGPETRQATIDFQRMHNLGVDGVAGNQTLGVAMQLGFPAASDQGQPADEQSPDWPPKPDDLHPLVSNADRQRMFGVFTYVAAPTPSNPEALLITNDWAKQNIVSVEIPQLSHVHYAPADCKVVFHQAAAAQLQKLWQDWEENGLLPYVLTWAGSWAPRFVRGSQTYLSNHAYGTAFDINAEWNPLGAQPALKGSRGCVRDLVQIANANGFWWGGHFDRRDGMHFEVCELQ